MPTPSSLVQVMANLGESSHDDRRSEPGGRLQAVVVGTRGTRGDASRGERLRAGRARSRWVARMPATQHDLWLWVAGHAYHTVFDVTREAIAVLAQIAKLATEVAGWTYKESRDFDRLHRRDRESESLRGTRGGARS